LLTRRSPLVQNSAYPGLTSSALAEGYAASKGGRAIQEARMLDEIVAKLNELFTDYAPRRSTPMSTIDEAAAGVKVAVEQFKAALDAEQAACAAYAADLEVRHAQVQQAQADYDWRMPSGPRATTDLIACMSFSRR